MPEIEDIQSWIGADVVDPEDHKVGKLDDVILDTVTGDAAYGITKSGLITRRSLAPLTGASFSRGYVRIAVSADLVASAPVDVADGVSPADHALLTRHFGVGEPATADDRQDGEDTGRFESVTVLAERERAAAADLRRAEALEAEAAARHEESGSLHHDAKERDARANDLETERDRLLAEAAEARAAAGEAPT